MSKTAKITQAQAKGLANAVQQYAQAHEWDFEYWFMHSAYMNTYEHNYESFEDAVEDKYRFFAKRDHKRDQEGYIANRVEDAKKDYEEHRQGIVITHTSSNTIRALEKKGIIEIISDGGLVAGWMYDKIRLLYI